MLKCQIVKTGNKNTNSPNSNKLFLQYCFIEQIPRRPNSSIVPKKKETDFYIRSLITYFLF